MGELVPFVLRPPLKLSDEALIDVGDIDLACRKLPGLEADQRAKGLDERQACAVQIRQAAVLHDQLWQELAALTLNDHRAANGILLKHSVRADHLVHSVSYRIANDVLEVEGFRYEADVAAPASFRLYPALADLRLIRICPYAPKTF